MRQEVDLNVEYSFTKKIFDQRNFGLESNAITFLARILVI